MIANAAIETAADAPIERGVEPARQALRPARAQQADEAAGDEAAEMRDVVQVEEVAEHQHERDVDGQAARDPFLPVRQAKAAAIPMRPMIAPDAPADWS